MLRCEECGSPDEERRKRDEAILSITSQIDSAVKRASSAKELKEAEASLTRNLAAVKKRLQMGGMDAQLEAKVGGGLGPAPPLR